MTWLNFENDCCVWKYTLEEMYWKGALYGSVSERGPLIISVPKTKSIHIPPMDLMVYLRKGIEIPYELTTNCN